LGVLNYKSDKQNGEAHFLLSHFSNTKKSNIFDVGGNVGSYSKTLRELNQNVEIYCFEPHPVTFQKLLENTKGLGIKTFNLGVGLQRSILNLYDYADKDRSSHASLYKDVIEKIHNGQAIAHK